MIRPIPIFATWIAAAVIACACALVGCGTESTAAQSPEGGAVTPDGGATDSGGTMDTGATSGDGGACVPFTANGRGDPDAGFGCTIGNGEGGIPEGFCDNGIRQLPPTCDPLIDALLERTPMQCASENSKHPYKLDSDPSDPDNIAHLTAHMCNLKGAVYWVSKMNIDCDGRVTFLCPGMGANADPSFQNDTFVHTNDTTNPIPGENDGGLPLASELDQYIVIPNDNYMDVPPGSIVAVIYGTKMTYAIFGDTGPPRLLGEGSMALANALGFPSSPANGGVLGRTVTFIAFTGTGGDGGLSSVPNDLEDRNIIEALGQQLTQQFLQDNPPTGVDYDAGLGVELLGPVCGGGGVNYCKVGETCCVTPGPSTTDAGTSLGAGNYPMASCMGSASQCGGVALGCSGASDCLQSGQLCCAQGSLAVAGSASCQTATACPGDQVCLSSFECQGGAKCRPLAGAGGIRTCVLPADAGSGGGDGGVTMDAAAE